MKPLAIHTLETQKYDTKYDTISRSVCYLGFSGFWGFGGRGFEWRGHLNVECASCSDASMISMTGDMPPHDEAAAMVALEQPEQTAAVAVVASNAAAELVELPHQQQVASFSLNLQTFESVFHPASIILCLPPPPPPHVCITVSSFSGFVFFLIFVNGVAMKECLSAGHSCFRSSIILVISHVSFFWSSSGIVIVVQCCTLELFLELSKMARKKGRKVFFLLLLLPLSHFLRAVDIILFLSRISVFLFSSW